MLKRDLSMSPSAAKLAVAQEKPPLGPRELHDAVSAYCGAACKVPFEPREDRPVYCSECFANMKAE